MDYDLDPVQRTRFLRYLVECALPSGTSVRLKYRGRTEVIGTGVANLGPSLQAGVMTTGDQERVSSCLLARTNATGTTLDIDLLGPYRGFDRPYDPKVFKVREAAVLRESVRQPDRGLRMVPGPGDAADVRP